MFFGAILVVLLRFVFFQLFLLGTKGRYFLFRIMKSGFKLKSLCMRKIVILNLFVSFCLVQAFAQNVDSLKTVARSLIQKDFPQDAALVYEKILVQDTASYESLAYLGNYNFLLGEKAIDKEYARFKVIPDPNRMQSAQHMDELKRLYHLYYEPSERYLQKAMRLNKNEHMKKLMVQIQAYKEKVGLVTIVVKKKKK